MKIHETARDDGTFEAVVLRVEGESLVLATDDAALALPDGALDAVMTRLGGPLETSEPVALVDRLDLGGGRALRHVRHRARWDVIARDFLVLDAPGAEPVCVLAVSACAALTHLARAAASRGG
ncbi:MAG TPA: hypothetical protein VIF62_03785 [Labilithrix sp.]|jgi:hypothetical protein